MAEIFNFNVQDNRSIQFPKANLLEPIMQEDHNVAIWRFRIPKVLNDIDMSAWAWWFVYVNAKGQKFTELLTLVDDIDEPDEYCTADYSIDYGVSYNPGSFAFSLESVNADVTGAILQEWHTKTYHKDVDKTLQGNQAQWTETESDIISALIVEFQTKIRQIAGGATPEPKSLIADMTDTKKVYLYVGSETGESTNYWYYYNGSAWVAGGLYASGITVDSAPTQGSTNAVQSGGVYEALQNINVTTDTTLSVSGKPADAKAVGDALANKVDAVSGKGLSTNDYTDADKSKVSDVGALKSTINGTESEVELLFVDGVRFTANATQYTSDEGNRGTYYIPCVSGVTYTFTANNNASSLYEFIFALATAIPAVNVAGQYIDKISVSGGSSGTFIYTPQADGYLSMSVYKNVANTFSATQQSGGLIRRISSIESDIAALDVSDLETAVNGTESSATLSFVAGLNFAEGATKYTYTEGAARSTYYVPVTKGNDYIIDIDNSGHSGSLETRFAFATEVPAVNVAGTYIEKTTTVSKGTASYNYTAQADGYLSASFWNDTGIGYSARQITGGLVRRTNVAEADITALDEKLDTEIGGIYEAIGEQIPLIDGIYWGATTVGTSLESAINVSTTDQTAKRAMIPLSAGQILRLYGAGRTSNTRLYWAFDATTGILIDISDTNTQAVPDTYYLRYDVDVHVYINCAVAYDHYVAIVDGVQSPFGDIAKIQGMRQTPILQLNGDNYVKYAVKNLRKKKRDGTVPATFLHFSDIHGDSVNLRRIVEFLANVNINPYIDNAICSGDVVTSDLSDGMEWYTAISGSENILLSTGNHDVIKKVGGTTSASTAEETYNALFASRVSGWSVVQPEGASENHLGYYYKDYSAKKLRLIVLDTARSDETYRADEITWLAGVLSDARTLGFAVICVEHFAFAQSDCTIVDCSFSPRDGFGSGYAGWTLPAVFISTVETFIGDGGEFVCWLCGHGHCDHVLLHNNTHQLCISISCATYNTERTSYDNALREYGTKAQDLVNLVAVDTYTKHISIMRIGSDLTRQMNSKKHLCIDYANRTVIWND